MVEESKNKFYTKIKEKLALKGSHDLPYQAVKQHKDGDRPSAWDIRNIDPTLTDEETANAAAAFFNSISVEIHTTYRL